MSAVLAIFQAKHLVADRVPTARFFPNFSRVQRRQVKLLAADAVHFFAQDLHDLQRDALAQRQVGIDAGAKLADQTGAQQKFVRNDFGVCRIFAKSGNEIL